MSSQKYSEILQSAITLTARASTGFAARAGVAPDLPLQIKWFRPAVTLVLWDYKYVITMMYYTWKTEYFSNGIFPCP